MILFGVNVILFGIVVGSNVLEGLCFIYLYFIGLRVGGCRDSVVV